MDTHSDICPWSRSKLPRIWGSATVRMPRSNPSKKLVAPSNARMSLWLRSRAADPVASGEVPPSASSSALSTRRDSSCPPPAPARGWGGSAPGGCHTDGKPMRQACKYFESRTYPHGDTVRKCDPDLAPTDQWRCPEGCPTYTPSSDDGRVGREVVSKC